MSKYEISDSERKIMLELLARVDLKGSEVPAFNQVLQVLSTPIKEEDCKED